MTIKQGLEANIIGAHYPNKIILQNVEGVVKFKWVMRMKMDRSAEFVLYADGNKELEVNLIDITKLVYENVQDYTDPFDYSETKLYTETQGYHYAKLDMSFEDENDTINVTNITVINGVLQVSECRIFPEFLDKELGVITEVNDDLLLNFELNEFVV